MRVYVDCDGVLADFDSAAIEILGEDPRTFEDREGSNEFWRRIRESDRFYYNLNLLPGAIDLMEYLAPLRPVILTGTPSFIPEGHFDKHEWSKEMFGPQQPMITCQSKNKKNFCRRGDYLIDDFTKYKEDWEAEGGIFIHHTSVEDTINRLRADLRFQFHLSIGWLFS